MTDSITTLTIYPQIVNSMIGLFKDECDLSRMTEQDVVSELEDIVEVYNENSYEQEVEPTSWCENVADYVDMEKVYRSSSLFKGYLSMAETIQAVVFLTACKAEKQVVKVLCDELNELKKTTLKQSDRLPEDMNNLICSFL